jgi:hypothetical protein
MGFSADERGIVFPRTVETMGTARLPAATDVDLRNVRRLDEF